MTRWPTKPLGVLAEVQWGNTSLTKASYVLDGFTAFSATGEDGFLPSYEHETDGIVLSAIGVNCGKCFLAKDKWTAIKNTITITNPAKELCTIRYLFYFLNNSDLWPKRGGGQPFISQGDARKIIVPVAPLAEQERIVKLLDEADDLRKLRAQADRRTADLIPALFHEMFEDPATNSRGWRTTTLGELASFITSGSRGWASYYSDNGAKFIRVQNLTGHQLTFDDIAYVSPPDNAESRRTKICPNDLLVTITGVVGLVACAPADIGDAYVSQHVAIVRLNKEADAVFTSAFLASYAGGQRQIAEMQYGQTKPGLNLAQLRSIRIYLPPLSLQRDFAARVAEIRAMATQQAASRRRLDDLLRSLLHRAFQGEL